MSTQPNRQAPFWSQPLDRLLTALNSTAQGLSSAEVARRLQQVGAEYAQSRATDNGG